VPERIRLSRQKGWRKPVGAVVVSRPSKWGNPFRVGKSGVAEYPFSVRGTMNHLLGCHETAAEAREHAVELFEMHIGPMGSYEYDAETLERLRTQLAGHDLACWCSLDQPCHADVLLKLANGPVFPEVGTRVTRTIRRGGKTTTTVTYEGTVTAHLKTKVRVRWDRLNGAKTSAHLSDHYPHDIQEKSHAD
jgi:hypothetical protein